MIHNYLKMNKVFERKMSVNTNSINESSYSSNATIYYNGYLNGITKKFSQKYLKENFNNYIKSISNNCEKYHDNTKHIINTLSEGELSNYICDNLFKSIFPRYSNMDKLKEFYGILPANKKNDLNYLIKEFSLCDRIIDNHKKISKRFSLDMKDNISIESLCENVCMCVDTYDMPRHVKMEIAFEESAYLLYNKFRNINYSNIVESVLDYFLITNDFFTDPSVYRKAISESKVLPIGSDKKVKLFMESDYDAEDDVKKLLVKYKEDTEKTDSKFKQIITKMFAKDIGSAIDDTPDVLSTLRKVFILGTIPVNGMLFLTLFIADGFIKMEASRKEYDRVIKYFKKELDKVDNKIYEVDGDKRDKLEKYKEALEKAINNLEKHEQELYTDDQYYSKDDEEDVKESVELSKNGYKYNVIMNNLIQDSIDADRLIDSIVTKTLTKDNTGEKVDIKDNITKDNFKDNIDENGNVSITLGVYNMYDNLTSSTLSRSNKLHQINLVSAALNNCTSNNSKVKTTIIDNIVEFTLVSKYNFILPLKESMENDTKIKKSDMDKINTISKYSEYVESLSLMEANKIIYTAKRRIGNPNKDKLFIELYKRTGNVFDPDEMKSFVNECSKYYKECNDTISAYNIIREFYNDNINTNSPDEIYNSIKLMNSLNEGVDLNTIKLAMMNFTKKAKTLGAKEKELSRNMDTGFNNFVRNVNSFMNASTVDAREKILRGNVMPSFSKMIKTGIGLTVAGVATGSIVFPSIALIAGLVKGKMSTDKEKKMMIDEIDIELDVVERELGKFDGSSKKYRDLITWKKHLERTRQKLLYGMEVKGKSFVKSTSGGYKSED